MSFETLFNYGVFYNEGKSLALYIAGLCLTAVISYLLGSINFGCLISKYKFRDDVREHGSGNAGTTNMLRTYGKAAAIFTLLGDMAKTALAVLVVGRLLCGQWGAYIAGLFCIIGHIYPIFFSFKGGKGVACVAAMVLCTNPIVFLILFVIFALLVITTKYVSLASVMCMLVYPLVLYRGMGAGLHIIVAIIVAVLIIFKHKENIKRLRAGNENKTELFKKKKKG